MDNVIGTLDIVTGECRDLEGNIVEEGFIDADDADASVSQMRDLFLKVVERIKEKIRKPETAGERMEDLLEKMKVVLFYYRILCDDSEAAAKAYATNEVTKFCSETINGLKK